ncbi:hypothetical protein NOVO_04935 [Rickettsiales bacterium Ac37b]|nr:hypothetical protein NOVO_04935 [Rickettsiales bacterium Ac37b]
MVEFGNNIINRTIGKVISSAFTLLNSRLNTDINIYFPLGIIIGITFPLYFESSLNQLATKVIEPGDSVLEGATNTVSKVTHTSSKEISNKYGFSLKGLIAAVVAIPFFDDQFLSGMLIGIGITIIYELPYIGMLAIMAGILLEYKVARNK